MPTPPALPDDLQAEVAALSERGDRLAEAGNYNAALERYREALGLLPPPANRYPAHLWLLVAMADAHFHRGDWGGCRQNLRDALQSGGSENAFVRLRLGQAHFELEELADAETHLFEAFRLGGEALFSHDAPRYLEWLRMRVGA